MPAQPNPLHPGYPTTAPVHSPVPHETPPAPVTGFEGVPFTTMHTQYWEGKDRASQLRGELERPDVASNPARYAEITSQLGHIEAGLLAMEAEARRINMYRSMTTTRPYDYRAPSPGYATRYPSAPVVSVTSPSGTNRYAPTGTAPSYAPRSVPAEAPAPYSTWSHVPGYNEGLAVEIARHTNREATNGHFRDSHHETGWKRFLTSTLFAGMGMFVQAWGNAAGQQLMSGNIPFDFLPKRSSHDDGNW